MESVTDLSEPVKVQVRARPPDFKVGQAIARASGVKIEELTPIKVTAVVHVAGMPKPCLTQLTSGPDGMGWKCSCNDSKRFCKHLVATALAVWEKAPKRP